MLSPGPGIAVTVGALVGVRGLLSTATSRYGLDPEYTRKLSRVGFGLVALAFPVLFDAVWPVVVFSGITVALAAAIPRAPGVVATALASAERRWRGDLCLVAAVTVLYALSGGDRILYGIPILTVTFAHAASALVGTRLGRTGIPLDTGKSLEGSVVFFVVAATCAMIPLTLMAGHRAADAVRIALVYAGIVTVIQAASGRASDNLSVPLAGYFAVSALRQHDATALHGVMLVATLLVGAVAIRRFFALGWSTEMVRQ